MGTSPKVRKRWLLAILLMAPFMAQADVTIANVATPSIRAGLGASGAEVELVIGGYLIAFAMLLITGARLGQTHGYRRVFLVGVGTFTTASLLCGLAPSAVVLIAARVAQGCSAALMFPQTLTGIQLNFAGAERTRAIGLYAVALSCGAAAGQILGGALISANLFGSDWRSIFFVNLPVGVAVLVAGARRLPPDEERMTRRLDGVGVATLASAVLLVLLPLVLGRGERWPLWTWLSLAASIPAFGVFVAVQRHRAARARSPLINVHAIARGPVSWGLGAVAAATGTYYALLFTLALYLQQGLARSPLVSGLTLFSFVAAFGIAGQIMRTRLAGPSRRLAPAGCLLLASAYAAISISLLAGGEHEALLIALLGAGGLGLGFQYNALLGHLTNAVEPHHAADISGVSTTTMQIAGALCVAALGSLYLTLATPHGAANASHAFAAVTAVLAGVALLAGAMARKATRGQETEVTLGVSMSLAASPGRMYNAQPGGGRDGQAGGDGVHIGGRGVRGPGWGL